MPSTWTTAGAANCEGHEFQQYMRNIAEVLAAITMLAGRIYAEYPNLTPPELRGEGAAGVSEAGVEGLVVWIACDCGGVGVAPTPWGAVQRAAWEPLSE